MNEFLRQFIMTGIRDMINRDVALYQTYQYAIGWFSKNVLTQEDLEEIQRLYEEKEMQEVTETIEEVQEEPENSAEEEQKMAENTAEENIEATEVAE